MKEQSEEITQNQLNVNKSGWKHSETRRWKMQNRGKNTEAQNGII